jgi:UDP-GlcNAc:undecaprenyl-phosphate GlcNAc-1-phosphate transferase
MNATMPEAFLAAAFAALFAGIVTNLLVPLIARLALALRAVDYPGERRQQARIVPRLGGIAILGGIALGSGSMAMMHWGEWAIRVGRSELVALAFGTLLIFLVGLVDDLLGVSAAKKFLVQFAAAWLLVSVGWSFEVLHLPWLGDVALGAWGPALSLVWIVGVTNAINLIDGLDGLAGGVVAIIGGSFLVYAVLHGNVLTVILMGSVVGACLGFLRHNRAPASIFMGDSGSLTLGFLLAVTSVHSSLKAPAAVAILVPILALGVPVMDTLLVMLVRFLERPKGRFTGRFLRMFHADRRHLHHLLSAYGERRRGIVTPLYALVFLTCGLALLVAVTRSSILGGVLLVGEFAVILMLRNLGIIAGVRRLAQQKFFALREHLRQQEEGAPASAAAAPAAPPPSLQR